VVEAIARSYWQHWSASSRAPRRGSSSRLDRFGRSLIDGLAAIERIQNAGGLYFFQDATTDKQHDLRVLWADSLRWLGFSARSNCPTARISPTRA
jgi:hypothetical protein